MLLSFTVSHPPSLQVSVQLKKIFFDGAFQRVFEQKLVVFGLEVDNLYNEQYLYMLSGRSHVTACVSRYETFLSFRGKRH